MLKLCKLKYSLSFYTMSSISEAEVHWPILYTSSTSVRARLWSLLWLTSEEGQIYIPLARNCMRRPGKGSGLLIECGFIFPKSYLKGLGSTCEAEHRFLIIIIYIWRLNPKHVGTLKVHHLTQSSQGTEIYVWVLLLARVLGKESSFE